MKKRSRNFPLIPGIILGAIFGAVAFMVLLRFPDFVIRSLSGDLRGLPRILSSIFYDAFSTPWGAIGGLVGGTMAWKGLRARPAPEARVDNRAAVNPESAGIGSKSWRIFHPGEAMLAWGLVFLVTSFGVFPSVMTYFLALWTLPPASLLLVVGVVRARNNSASGIRQFAGFGLLLLGLVALSAAALVGTYLSYQLALPSYNLAHQIQRPGEPVPGVWDWARFVGTCLIPVVLIGPGLRLWTDWARSRRVGWCAVILLFPLTALLLHRTFVAIGFLPLSA